ncbi:MAG: hypothetical protein M3Y37_08965 [Chloroflexota bacterium]|nr:hypothetical protein [Chloroflexota bacterium]
MPRINTRKVDVNDVPRFCPNCGAANTTAGLRCTICGHEFTSPDQVAGMWGDTRSGAPSKDDDFGSLYSAPTPEPEPLPVFTPPDPAEDLHTTRPFTPVVDPWSSAGGRLGAEESAGKFVPPIGDASRQRTAGPPGWLLGVFGLLLILGVAGAAAWFVGRPLLADALSDSASDGIERAVAEVTIVPSAGSGNLVVSEASVNRAVRLHRESFEPASDVRVHIRRSGVEIDLTIYGVDTTLTGDLTVEDRRIVIENPELSGVAERVVDLDEIVSRVEDAVNDLLLRSNLVPTAVVLADDTMTITTVPATTP